MITEEGKGTHRTLPAEFTRKQQRQGRGYPKSSPYKPRHAYFRDNVALVELGSLLGLTPRKPTGFPELDNFAVSVASEAWKKVAYFGSI